MKIDLLKYYSKFFIHKLSFYLYHLEYTPSQYLLCKNSFIIILVIPLTLNQFEMSLSKLDPPEWCILSPLPIFEFGASFIYL